MPAATSELIEEYGEPDDVAGDSDCTNVDRAGWALAALNTFLTATRHRDAEKIATVEDLANAEVLGEVVPDLICDLLHLATLASDYSFTAQDIHERGFRHFAAEVGMGYDT